MRRVLAVLALVLCLPYFAPVARAAGAGDPVLIEPSKESWPIAELDPEARAGVQLIGAERQRYDVKFRLPEGTANGKPKWYLIKLDVRLRFAAPARGEWGVVGEMNGYTGARVDFSVEQGQATVSSLSLLGGRRTRTTTATEVTEQFVNYAQDGGLIPGRVNVLSFWVETDQSTGLTSAEVLPSSGLELTSAQPTEIGLGTPEKALVAAVGETIEVPFGVSRRGGHPDAPIDVELSPLRSGMSVVGESHQKFSGVGAGIRGKFVIKVETAGEYRVGIRALGHYNPAGGEVSILAGPRGPDRIRWWLIIPIALLTLTIGARQLLRYRRGTAEAR
ncbi:hypothetical protein AB0P21_16875 [Kribbella sp. NPDC056861]|uniref:hypothetical protein n=1 Tax=Kribbella sp. NPDC056861 TaxID=3154857 RepID=UPI0034249B85